MYIKCSLKSIIIDILKASICGPASFMSTKFRYCTIKLVSIAVKPNFFSINRKQIYEI